MKNAQKQKPKASIFKQKTITIAYVLFYLVFRFFFTPIRNIYYQSNL